MATIIIFGIIVLVAIYYFVKRKKQPFVNVPIDKPGTTVVTTNTTTVNETSTNTTTVNETTTNTTTVNETSTNTTTVVECFNYKCVNNDNHSSELEWYDCDGVYQITSIDSYASFKVQSSICPYFFNGDFTITKIEYLDDIVVRFGERVTITHTELVIEEQYPLIVNGDVNFYFDLNVTINVNSGVDGDFQQFFYSTDNGLNWSDIDTIEGRANGYVNTLVVGNFSCNDKILFKNYILRSPASGTRDINLKINSGSVSNGIVIVSKPNEAKTNFIYPFEY